ncbi:GNAT family N-acetyltransferase [Nocardiopsis halophila]|uniref:GNAT family N-acetyltransferase n=1 Tax=Nocardiopsis halophila TaxID=141692 RepID=UPI00034C7477|nr:GNAT family N-acetyltransferase [Nocardiopsis halophila]
MRMNWVIGPADVDGPEAEAVLREYYRDIVARYSGRPASEADIDAAMKEEPSDALAPPTGLFLLARRGGGAPAAVGCVALRWFDGGVAEVKRLFVHPQARGEGGGAALLAAAERAAAGHGAGLVRLDTRSDLAEARRLYAANGYTEVAPFSQGPYADHWFAKRL